jgi:plastocyanin
MKRCLCRFGILGLLGAMWLAVAQIDAQQYFRRSRWYYPRFAPLHYYPSQTNPYAPYYGQYSSPSFAYSYPPTGYQQNYQNTYQPYLYQASSVLPVAVYDFYFAPGELKVTAGTTVHWVNNGGHNHTVTSQTGGWDSGDIRPGASFTAIFAYPGVYDYFCRHHPNMVGRIVVVEGGASSSY